MLKLIHHLAAPLTQWLAHRRLANSIIQLATELNIQPETLVDVGANNSQVGSFLRDAWKCQVISFEPNPHCKPIGEVRRIALGHHSDEVSFRFAGEQSDIDPTSATKVQLRRFDALGIEFSRPAVLKVDAEQSTFSALVGFGGCLQSFEVVVVEMWNHPSISHNFVNQQSAIWELMHARGFSGARVLDSLKNQAGVLLYDIAFYKPKDE